MRLVLSTRTTTMMQTQLAVSEIQVVSVVESAHTLKSNLSGTDYLGDGKAGKDMQSLNARSPMWATEVGTSTCQREQQSRKASAPMAVTEEGMVKHSKELQPSKAASPTWVTELGTVTLAKETQF